MVSRLKSEKIIIHTNFVSYDEPRYRTSLSIEIQHIAGFTAVSNAPEMSKTLQNGTIYAVTKFHEIHSIPTHVIGFMISNLEHVEDVSGSTPLRVYAKPQAIESGYADRALEVSAKLLPAFEQYLGKSYALGTFDQVAIPRFNLGKFR